MPKDTIQQAGLKFVAWFGEGQAVFKNLEANKYEVWFANRRHASYGFTWRGTDWEFARTIEKGAW